MRNIGEFIKEVINYALSISSISLSGYFNKVAGAAITSLKYLKESYSRMSSFRSLFNY